MTDKEWNEFIITFVFTGIFFTTMILLLSYSVS